VGVTVERKRSRRCNAVVERKAVGVGEARGVTGVPSQLSRKHSARLGGKELDIGGGRVLLGIGAKKGAKRAEGTVRAGGSSSAARVHETEGAYGNEVTTRAELHRRLVERNLCRSFCEEQ
jgi:hypothetical protein